MTKSKICIQYSLYSIMVIAVIFVFSWIFEGFIGKQSGSSTGALGALIAAYITGQYYYKHAGEASPKSERWTYALYFTGIQALLALIILPIIAFALPESFNLSIPVILLAFCMMIVMSLVANRIGFGWGLNDAEKASAKAP
ncbi:MAG: hypothetical protein GY750_16960 [Lentisphaerae bacterium]|nr:hypothetical protein [Lentisphaerota bacterium]